MTFTCDHCHKEFVRETSMVVHMCEPKRRRGERTERGVQLGLQAYLKFYEVMQGSAKLKTFDDFADSPYYRAFVKFGRYCINARVINPMRFTEWLLKQNKKLDRWSSDQLYEEYLVDYLRCEHVNDALARAIEYSITWGEDHQTLAHDFMRYGNKNVICHAITTGRISAWAIYNCASGLEFLETLDPALISMIWPYIDADIWQKRFREYPADVEYAKEMLRQAGW